MDVKTVSKKLCIVSPGGSKWVVDKIKYSYEPVSKTGYVLGIVKGKEPYLVAEISEIEDKEELIAIFTDGYCVKEVSEESPKEDCSEVSIEKCD